jgi:ATP-binding cassette, subfamily B, bacterial MsbA
MKQLSPLYQRLLAFVKPYLFPFVLLMAAAMLILAGTEGTTIVLIKYLGDQLTTKHDFRAVEYISAGILVLFLIRAIAEFVADYLEAYITQKITLDLRAQLNSRLQDKPLSFFNQTPTGVILSRVISDVQVTTSGAIDSLFGIFSGATRLVAVLAGAFYLDWQLALGAFVVFPAAVLPVAKFSRQMRKMSKDSQKQLSGLAVLLQEAFQGNRVVKAFGMEDYERARFHRELRRLFRISMRVARIKALTGPLIEVMGALAIVGAILWGSHSVLSGTRSPGTFIAFIGAMVLIYQPFKSLTRTNNAIQSGLGAAERVFAMIDAPDEVPDDPAGLNLFGGNHLIRFEQVNFRYGDNWVLQDINLVIGAGEVVALVGMSGGGKSTIADLIPRFYDVQQGRITVDGIDVRRLKIAALRAQIGIVTQQTFLFNDTIRANIAYGSQEKRLDDIIAAARAANAHDFIERLPDGYDTIVGELGVRISGGERQRLAIARALLKNAPILILDEATSALDSDAERQVQEALERLMENRTTLVIAHRLSTVRRANRIAVIVHGRVVEEGTHDELLARGGEYNRLYDLQFNPPAELAINGALAN